jgi:dipeptidyl-peptidase-4
MVAVVALWAAAGAADADEATKTDKVLTVERIYASPPITGRSPSGIRWLADSKGVSFLMSQGNEDDAPTQLIIAEVPKGKRRTVCIVDTIPVPDDLRKKDDDMFAIRSYRWAKSGDFLAFIFKGEVFTMDARGVLTRRTESEVSEKNLTIAPDASKLAFTRDYDIWALDLATGEETQLTTTGSDSLLNGALDWVYMEELFTRGDVQGYWWSPDSRTIAYLQIDESPVREFPIVDYVPVYNEAEMQHYPKAGAENPIVRVGVCTIENAQTTWLDIDTKDDSYVARVYWLGNSEHVAIEKLNRAQDELQLLFADAATGQIREVIEESRATWVNITYMKHYYETKDLFIWNSERDGHSHLYLYNNDGDMVRQLTNGPWEVTALNDVDEKRGHIYLTSNKGSVIERHIFRIGEKGGKIRQLSKKAGTHSATFSPNHKYYVNRYSSVTSPTEITVNDATGKELFALHEADTSELAQYRLPVPEFFRITSREGLEFHCSMIKPADFDPTMKYLIYTYGGPHAQVVRNRWGASRYLWHAYMAQRGYVIFSLDNRGSFGRGTEWEDPIIKDLGHLELKDQIAGVDFLKTLPYVDDTRIGIWGWSYGGYMTSMAMLKAPGVFTAGAAVAPVTDWRFYDTIYTERYMKRPQDNEDGYHDSSPINFADGLQAPFLLVHGTADDNVHAQNSMALVYELISAGKDFDLMFYPRKLHGISGESARVHLYRRLTKFFDDNLYRAPEATRMQISDERRE